MYKFIGVDKNNFEEVIALKKKDEQKDFLMENVYSIAQAKVYSEYIPKAIYYNDDLIGFVFYHFIDNKNDSIFLKRYMIDREYQSQHHGKKALLALLEYYKKEYDINIVELMHYPNNIIAAKLYESCDFMPTGEIREGEIVREYKYK